MSLTTTLERICGLFASDPEPARTVREFRALPVPDGTIAGLSRRSVDAPRDR